MNCSFFLILFFSSSFCSIGKVEVTNKIYDFKNNALVKYVAATSDCWASIYEKFGTINMDKDAIPLAINYTLYEFLTNKKKLLIASTMETDNLSENLMILNMEMIKLHRELTLGDCQSFSEYLLLETKLIYFKERLKILLHQSKYDKKILDIILKYFISKIKALEEKLLITFSHLPLKFEHTLRAQGKSSIMSPFRPSLLIASETLFSKTPWQIYLSKANEFYPYKSGIKNNLISHLLIISKTNLSTLGYNELYPKIISIFYTLLAVKYFLKDTNHYQGLSECHLIHSNFLEDAFSSIDAFYSKDHLHPSYPQNHLCPSSYKVQ